MKQFILGNFGRSSSSYTDAYLKDVVPKCHGAWVGDFTDMIMVDRLKVLKPSLRILLYHCPIAIAERYTWYSWMKEAMFKHDPITKQRIYNTEDNFYYSDMDNQKWRDFSTSYITMRLAVNPLIEGVFVDEANELPTGYFEDLHLKSPDDCLIIPNCRADRNLHFAHYADGYFSEDNPLYISSGKKYAEVWIK